MEKTARATLASEMKPETQRVIEMLNSAPLLRGGGQLDTSRYSMVTSFGDACNYAESPEWERFYGEVHNGIFTGPVQRRIWSEFNDSRAWIKILEEDFKALTPAIINMRQVEWSCITRFPFEGLLVDICAELEISHIVEPVFFYPVVFPVLCAGHFPCGWDGDPIPENWSPKGPNDMLPGKLGLPSGKLMVHKIVFPRFLATNPSIH